MDGVSRTRSRFRRRKGRASSILQTTVTIGCMAVMAGVSAPVIKRYMTQAKTLRATREVRILGSAMTLFMADMRFTSRMPPAPGGGALKLLISEGQAPGAGGSGARPWLLTYEDPGVASFDDYLMDNACGFKERKGKPGGAAWDGPYVNVPTPEDPWGNRYACNIGVIEEGYVPIIVSAGPDGKMSLPFYLTLSEANRKTGGAGDDIFFILQ